MKTILSKISRLEQSIEYGLLTRSEATREVRLIYLLVADKYEEGSDNFMLLLSNLTDTYTLIQDTYIN